METCAAETGLLKKKPCGSTAVTKCANCEMPLCGKHAVAQTGGAGRKTGTFLCAECHAAQRAYEKNFGTAPAATTPAAAPTAAPKPAAKPPAAAPAKPAAAPPKPPASAPAAPPKPDEDSLGSIDFEPSKK
jgi:hypothetical protein